ncbi:MAG: AAA family ATPase, partial [Chloroflexota bacterium]
MAKLPIGIQDFSMLREDGYTYVDKTEQIHRLIHTGPILFLSRPRRFGKSLLLTTLAVLFRGRQPLFEGLWIENQHDWEPRPVLLLNFNDINTVDMPLADALTTYMDDLAEAQGISLKSADYKGKFGEFIERLATKNSENPQRIVLLVDEYDKPITDNLDDSELVQANVRTLKAFYSTLKSSVSTHLHFTLISGVSKYGKVSIFSDLNNLLDITLDPRFATLLGYTEDEL